MAQAQLDDSSDSLHEEADETRPPDPSMSLRSELHDETCGNREQPSLSLSPPRATGCSNDKITKLSLTV